jgi:hypothetical protein
MTVEKLAEEALAWFEYRKRRPDQEEAQWFHKDGAPSWITDLCRAAHDTGGGDLMLPDDYRYEYLVDALDYLAEGHDPDDYWPDADVYNSDLLAWLGSHLGRAGYVDEARKEGLFGRETDTYAQIGAGQVQEKREVFGLVLTFLQWRAEALEDDEDEAGGAWGDPEEDAAQDDTLNRPETPDGEAAP